MDDAEIIDLTSDLEVDAVRDENLPQFEFEELFATSPVDEESEENDSVVSSATTLYTHTTLGTKVSELECINRRLSEENRDLSERIVTLIDQQDAQRIEMNELQRKDGEKDEKIRELHAQVARMRAQLENLAQQPEPATQLNNQNGAKNAGNDSEVLPGGSSGTTMRMTSNTGSSQFQTSRKKNITALSENGTRENNDSPNNGIRLVTAGWCGAVTPLQVGEAVTRALEDSIQNQTNANQTCGNRGGASQKAAVNHAVNETALNKKFSNYCCVCGKRFKTRKNLNCHIRSFKRWGK